MSIRPPVSPADELQRAAEVLSQNWILAVPTALASLTFFLIVIFIVLSVVGTTVLGGLAGGHLGAAAGLGTGAIVALLASLLGAGVVVLAQAVVIHASEDAWQGLSPNLGASLGAVLGRLPDLLVATILSGLIVAALCLTVIGIPFVAVASYFLMYVTPAVILGRESGTGALATSFRIARTRVGESFVAFLGLIAASIVGVVANTLLGHIPLVNLLTAFAIGGLTSAYAALVQARFYDLLRIPAAYPIP
ncbi:MAG: hypothetical protein WAJ85_08635 [Candidatus Baltobacteraceae bacterium]|jgi:hypothetical protein